MNGMQGTAVGLVIGGGVAAGIVALALGGSDPNLTGGAALTPGAGTAAIAPAELEQLKTDAARIPELERELEAAKAKAASAAAVEGGAAASAAQVAKLQAEILVLKNERAELREALAAAKAAAGAPAETAAPGTFRFGLSGQTPTFDKADWPKLGGHLVELAKAITTLPEAIASGKGIDMATRQKLAQHNTPLAGFAVSAAQELGGTGPNGAFTHPAVMANLMRAALEAAELPLSPEQEQHIASIGEAWSAREAERLGRYNESTPALAKTIDEVDLKQRFINDVRKTLTKAQDAVVFPPSTVGRAQLDLFSPALVYAMRQPVTATDRPGLEQQMLESLGTSLAWTPQAAAPYAYLVTEWCDALPKAMEAKPRTHPDVTFPHIDDIQAAARVQLAITQKLLALGELAQAQADALRANTTVLQPQLIKTP